MIAGKFAECPIALITAFIAGKDAPEIVRVGEYVFLQGKKRFQPKSTRINRGNVIVDLRYSARRNHFSSRSSGKKKKKKKRAGLYGRIVRYDHGNVRPQNAGRGPVTVSRGRGPHPTLRTFSMPPRKIPQLKELRTRIDQLHNALARAVSRPFFVLGLNRLRAAALADLLFLILDLREQIDHPAGYSSQIRATSYVDVRFFSVERQPLAILDSSYSAPQCARA